MELWLSLKIIWMGFALVFSGASLIILWRVRGILNWKISLKQELRELRKTAEQSDDFGKQALGIIESRCERVLRSFSPEVGELRDLPDFITSIAACYHPGKERPELQITMGPFLRKLDNSLDRFDHILQRPGLKRLRGVSISNIRNFREWYVRLSESRIWGWYFRHRKNIQRVSHIRFLLIPDPFSWVAYLSGRLTILSLTRYLMTDIYLFFGKLSMEAYGGKDNGAEENQNDLEKILEDLEDLEQAEEHHADPEIREIRNRLLGVSAMLFSNPGFKGWKDAVYEAAGVISKKYFPESDAPLEEAAVGPLLERTRSWIATFSKGEDFPVVNRFYKMRLETLYRAKDFSKIFLPKSARGVIEKALKTYGWLKWPLKAYQLTKAFSPWKIALDLGWTAAKKGSLAYIYGKTFDKACNELESVYLCSRKLRNRSRANVLQNSILEQYTAGSHPVIFIGGV